MSWIDSENREEMSTCATLAALETVLKNHDYKITKTAIKDLVVGIIRSKYVPLTTKLKAIVGTISINGAVYLCNLLSQKV